MLRGKDTYFSELLMILVASAVAIQLYYTPYSGDDWVYLGAYTGYKSVCHNPYEWLKLGFGHWLTTNGRFANIGLTPLLLFPKWLLSLLCGAAMYGMCKYAVRAVCAKQCICITSLMVSLLVFTLPWWDSMMVFDCQFNYVFSAFFCLLAYKMMFSKCEKQFEMILKPAFCFIAGMMHEAASMPLCAGIAVYMFYGGAKPVKKLFYSFVSGAIIVTFSPGIWLRASHLSTPDDILPVLLLKSDFAALLVLLGILVCLLQKKRRERLKNSLSQPVCIFAVASLISMTMSGVSGIVGRSGWFAEIYAFIVILILAKDYLQCIPKYVYYTLSAIVVAHVFAVAYFQQLAGKEYETFDKEYVNSCDGLVFFDYTRDNEWSILLLNKLRGVPDPDDTYLLKTYSEHYSPSSRLPVVLPSEAKEILNNGFSGEKVLECGDILTTVKPRHLITRTDGLMLFDNKGEEWVIQPFEYHNTQYYHLSKRILDPGDR